MNHKHSKPNLEAPRIPVDLPLLTWAMFQTEDYVEKGRIQDCAFENLTVSKVTFDAVTFTNVTITEASFINLELIDVIFDHCNLTNVNFAGAGIHRTEFRHCKILGLDLTDAILRNVLFHDCLGDYAAFRFANMKHVHLEECSLRHADFYNASFLKVFVRASNIDQAQLSGTRLAGIDLSDSIFNGLGVEVENLRGCIISREQASIFANLWGLIVKD